jgi:hypothetical protein
VRSIEILREKLSAGFDFLHVRRQQALWRGVEALMVGGRLWLTALGRDMTGQALEKHRIKAADRLLGNRAIQQGLVQLHRALATWLLQRSKRPVLLVDWTGCGPEQYMLRVGLPFRGRSILLYGCVVAHRKLGNPSVHRQFLQTLATILPSDCRPVVVTDAGFHHHWFEAVTELGWDFIGRIRGAHHVRVYGEKMPLRQLFLRAGKRAVDLGIGEVGANRADPHRLILSARPKLRGRRRLGRRGKPRRAHQDVFASAAARAPLLLATSLRNSARKVVAVYATRMQIEESFRDLKSYRFGWDFSSAMSKDARRIEVLLLIATLASVALLVLGTAAERCNLHHRFQANTIRKRRVLSLLTLGRRILRRGLDFPPAQLRSALVAVQAGLATVNPLQTSAR